MEIPSSEKSRVRVHAKLTVVSSTPVERGRFYRLTPLDHAMANHTVRLVYYYDQSSQAGGSMEFDRLRMSLCELLSMYPVLTGRLGLDGEGNWQLKCTDAGVRVLKAKVGATLDEWLRSADREDERDLTAWDDLPDDAHIWPPFRIQLNDFECGGLAIGLSFTHLLCDPTTATFFFKSWSEFHRRQAISHPPFIQPAAVRSRSPPFTTTKSAAYYASKTMAAAAKTFTSTATFSFSDGAVREWISKIRPTCPGATPFDLLAALFWTSIAKLSTPEVVDNCTDYHSLTICVDFRKRLHAPLPYGYFGNAVYFSRLTSDGGELDGGDLGRVAELIHHHVEGIDEEEVWSTVDWLDSRKDEKGRFVGPFMMYGPELTCVNMEHLIEPRMPHGVDGECGPMMYISAFEKGAKPVHVSYDVADVGGPGGGEGLFFVTPSPEGEMARRVKVVLPEELVAKLCDDTAIRSLAPTIMIGGSNIFTTN